MAKDNSYMLKNNPKSRQENLVVQELNNEVLIYDLNLNKAFCLNKTSSFVWQLCDGNNSVSDISENLCERLKMIVSEELVWLALEQFKRDDLLEKSAAFEIEFAGLTRRQVIKNIGFGSMVALPIVGSIVAPLAISAQSQACLATRTRGCVSPSQCCSGSCQVILGVSGDVCCVATNTDSSPGFRCAPDQATCDAFALLNCCSGQADFGALALCSNSPSPGDLDCTCLENRIGFL